LIEDICMESESTEASLGDEGLMDQATEEASPKGSIRVLYVDDEPAMLEIVKQYLEMYDPFIAVYAVISPEEALEVLKEESFDCIVSDYSMPGMNGVEFANEAIRRKGIPFIIYTGKGSDEVAEEAFANGVDDYLRKEMGATHYKILAKRIISSVERYRAKRELLESETKYSKLVEGGRYGIAIIDGPEPRLCFVNSVLANMLGYSIKELTSFTTGELHKIVHPDDLDRMLENIKDRLEGKVTKTKEYRFVRKNGELLTMNVTSSVIERGGKPALQVVLFNRSEEQEPDSESHYTAEMYQRLIELAPDGVITFDLKGYVTSINPAYSMLTGFSEEQIVNKHFTKIGAIKARDIPRYLKILSSVVRGKVSDPIEFEYSRMDGSTRWGEGRFSLVKHRNNKREILAIARDITDRKRASEKLKVVGKLTRHDVRNKLSVIMGYLDLVTMGLEKSQPVDDYLGRIRDTTYQVVKILNFAADYERLGIEERRSIGVSESFKTALSMFSIQGIKVNDQCEGTVVQADSMLSRVFYNFIDNTLKHGGEVTEIKIYVEEGENLKITYQDDGAGIPYEKKEKIFLGEIEKTGVHGLNLINRIIESYGWTIKEVGVPGKGVEFVITVPVQSV
jgi:PAS domain S-box-containing protein